MWFKGSLHIHTTNSDGELNPLEACKWYKNKGFDFIAITDHDVITKIDKKPSRDFLVIENSVEFTYPDIDLHIQGIGLKNSKLELFKEDLESVCNADVFFGDEFKVELK